MTTLTLEVHYPPAEMPDADTDVLVWDASSPIAQLGAYIGEESDGPVWTDAQGGIVPSVVAWAEMPVVKRSPVVGRIGRDPDLVPLVNGRSIDLGARWSLPT